MDSRTSSTRCSLRWFDCDAPSYDQSLSEPSHESIYEELSLQFDSMSSPFHVEDDLSSQFTLSYLRCLWRMREEGEDQHIRFEQVE